MNVINTSPPAKPRFVRLNKWEEPMTLTTREVEDIARFMSESSSPGPDGLQASLEDLDKRDLSRMPAGYTYFGQFIDHDLTHDATSHLAPDPAPKSSLPVQLGAAAFNLSGLYGVADNMLEQDGCFLISHCFARNPATAKSDLPRDLEEKNDKRLNELRLKASATGKFTSSPQTLGIPLIADLRNADNLALMHIQLLFMQFHNKLMRQALQEGALLNDMLVRRVKSQVLMHYQWLIMHDFLPRILGKSLYTEMFSADYEFKLLDGDALSANTIPIEFSGAACRFGHSIVRNTYLWNANLSVNRPVELQQMLIKGGIKSRTLDHTTRHSTLWWIDWCTMFPFPGHEQSHLIRRGPGAETRVRLPDMARKINQTVAEQLSRLPNQEGKPGLKNLMARNLARASKYGLPSGTAFRDWALKRIGNSHEYGLSDPALIQKLGSYAEYKDRLPLWYYFLVEAEWYGEKFEDEYQHGACLGPLAGRLVGEVFLNCLSHSPHSILGNDKVAFFPLAALSPPMRKLGLEMHFTFADLVRYVYGDTDAYPDAICGNPLHYA